MSHKRIEQLTPEQEILIPVYQEKWRKIALSTERIDREKAASAVKEAYAVCNLHEPEIIFCDSPYGALREIESQLGKRFKSLLYITENITYSQVVSALESM